MIKVTPYDFFTGIGDINSSFLPKREDIIAAPPPPEPKPKPTNGNAAAQKSAGGADTANPISEHERVIANGDGENALLQLQAEEQERALEKQLKDRPLLHLQEELDREDEEAEKKSTDTKNGDSPEPAANGESETSSHQRHKLLRDDDRELEYLEKHLTTLHRSFYEQYDARCAHRRPDDLSPDVIPDVGSTLTFLKSQVLRDTTLVLSGLVPLDVDVRRTEIGMQAESFGAEIRARVSDEITHLVINIARPRTQKVRQAARIPSIKIVNQNWLADSIAQWTKLDETPYLVQIHPADRNSETPREEGSASPQRPKITIITSGRQQMFEDGMTDGANDGDADDSGDEEDEDDEDEDDDNEQELRDQYNLMPLELQDGQRSPIDNLDGMEWGDVDRELEEFMGTDIDDSDLESTQGTDRGTDTESDEPSSRGKKRKLGEDGYEDDDGAESALAKKQRIANARISSLRHVRNATDEEDEGEGSGLPTPMGTGDDEDDAAATAAVPSTTRDGAGDEEEDDDDDEDFADLEAELEAELAAEGEGG